MRKITFAIEMEYALDDGSSHLYELRTHHTQTTERNLCHS